MLNRWQFEVFRMGMYMFFPLAAVYYLNSDGVQKRLREELDRERPQNNPEAVAYFEKRRQESIALQQERWKKMTESNKEAV